MSASNASLANGLRPRTTRRLISGLDEELSIDFSTSTATTSRSASPRKSPSRAPRQRHASSSSSSSTLSGVWGSSWSTLQGLASNVSTALVSGGSGGGGGRGSNGINVNTGANGFGIGKASSGGRSLGKARLSMAVSASAVGSTPSEWGPSSSFSSSGLAHTHIGAGSNQDREALVRQAKRMDMLDPVGYGFSDSMGRFKRRSSLECQSPERDYGGSNGNNNINYNNNNNNGGGDALVYVHIVQPGDTVAGITIRYNCQPAVLRKANRMWPNDPIQARKTIVLPVDSCAIKGRPVPGPDATGKAIVEVEEEEDLLGSETISMHESPSTPTNSLPNGWQKDAPPSSQPTINSPQHDHDNPPSSVDSSSQVDTESLWKHDSWVLLPNDTRPTEIGRLPRNALGFFPRARRKSNTFSDIGTSNTTSFDLPRTDTTSSSAKISPVPILVSDTTTSSSSSPPTIRPTVVTTRARSTSNTLATYLHGPGGVGSLSKTSRAPGPAPDSLNRIFGPHLPNVAPPPSQTAFTPWYPGLLDDASDNLISFGPSSSNVGATIDGGTATPGLDFQDVGGAIEGWVRKMAKRAAAAVEAGSTVATSASSKGNTGVQVMGVGSGVGDLIELVDAFEIGDDEDAQHVDDGRHRAAHQTDLLAAETSARPSGELRGRRRLADTTKGGKDD